MSITSVSSAAFSFPAAGTTPILMNEDFGGLFISKIARKSRVLTEETIHSLSTLVYCIDLDRTTLRELINSEDRLIPDIPIDDVPRVAAQRAPKV
ncbi:hypothetical protein Tco_0305366 [Tanacetum coccineum]